MPDDSQPKNDRSDQTMPGTDDASLDGEDLDLSIDESDSPDGDHDGNTIVEHSSSTADLSSSPRSAGPPKTASQFAERLSESGLYSVEELAKLYDAVPDLNDSHEPQTIANTLVQYNRLTRFQADLLLQGRTRGLILGNYEIMEKIGEGGMGVVYKALHRRMKRTVAVKVLPPALTQRPDSMQRFLREVEAAARLQHANIAAAFDADDSDGIHFLVMEFVDGPNLADYVKQAGPVSIPVAVNLITQTARGLAHAHRKGIVHRDIKPANLLVGHDGVVKVLDMGLAAFRTGEADPEMAELTQSGRVMGTVDYMAPEQALNAKTVDHRADIYSLGCTLFFLLTGKAMSPDGTLTQKLLWHQREPIPPLASVTSETPERLDAIFQRMVAKRPEERHGSMDEVLADLAACDECMPDTSTELAIAGIELSTVASPATDHGQQEHKLTIIDRPRSKTQGSSATVTEMPESERPASLPVGKLIAAVVVLAALLFGAYAIMRGGPDESVATGPDTSTGTSSDPDNTTTQPRPTDNGTNVPSTDATAVGPDTPKQGMTDAAAQSGAAPADNTQQPPTTDLATDNPQPTPRVISHQATLDWVFSLDGNATVSTEAGNELSIASLEDAPNKPFQVTGISLVGATLPDDSLQPLAKLTRLESLALPGTSVTDEQLAAVSRLLNLTSLDLSETKITDASLAHIERLSHLEQLDLRQTKVTDQGVSGLLGLTNLKRLHLSDTETGDSTAAKVKLLPALEQLSMNGTFLTDAGYAALKKQHPDLVITWDGPDLERQIAQRLLDTGAKLTVQVPSQEPVANIEQAIQLPRHRFLVTEVTATDVVTFDDDALTAVSDLSGLRSLRLAGTTVTSDGLPSLFGVRSLQTIDLGTLPIDRTTITTLKQRIPDIEILQQLPPDQLAAEWIIRNGGTVRTVQDGDPSEPVNAIDALPTQRYQVHTVQMSDRPELTDESIAPIAKLKNLRSLRIARTKVSDAGLALFAKHPNLEEIDMSEGRTTDKGLQVLPTLPNLTRLAANRLPIDDTAVNGIAKQTGLTHLSLDGTQLTDSSVSSLRNLSKLQVLVVTNTSLTDSGIESLKLALPKCRVQHDPLDEQRLAARWLLGKGATVTINDKAYDRVTTLPPAACKITSIDLSDLSTLKGEQIGENLSECSDLVNLNLSGTRITDGDLRFLKNLSSLTELHLSNTAITDQALVYLRGNVKLEILDIGRTRVSGIGLSRLEDLKNLRSLIMDQTVVSDRLMETVAKFADLDTLDLSSTRITDAGLAQLAELKKVRVLSLKNTPTSDAALSTIAKWSALEYLLLDNTDITDSGVSKLSSLTNLQNLSLYGTQTTDGAAGTLRSMKKLKQLNLVRTKVTSATAKSIEAALPGCDVLRSAERPRGNQLPGQNGAPTPPSVFIP